MATTIPTVTMRLTGAQQARVAFPTPDDPGRDYGKGWRRWYGKLGPLGVRFYAREIEPGVIEYARWVANAFPLTGPVDYDALTLEVRSPWSLMRPVVAPSSGVQTFPSRRGRVERFVVYAAGKEARAVEVLEGRHEMVHTDRPTYGPTRLPLPTVDPDKFQGAAEANLVSLRMARAQGGQWYPSSLGLDSECGLTERSLGDWHPQGVKDGGAPGGSRILFFPGWDRTLAGALTDRDLMDLIVQRTVHAWQPTSGDYLQPEDYTTAGAAHSPIYSGSRNPSIGDGELPGYSAPGVGPSACPYRADLEEWATYDPYHLCRALMPALRAWEDLGDPVAADLIIDLASESRLIYSNRGYIAHPSETWIWNLSNVLAQAKANPGQGGWLGRGPGWMAHAVASALHVKKAIGLPHDGELDWGKKFVEMASLTQMPNGFWHRHHSPPLWGTPDVDSAQSFEAGIFSVGLYAVSQQAGLAHRVTARIKKQIEELLLNRELMLLGDPWHDPSNTSWGPPHFVYVAAHGGQPFEKVTTGKDEYAGSKGGDPAHVEAMLALGYAITHASRFLNRLTKTAWPSANLEKEREQYETSNDLNWTSLALACLQGRV